MKNIGVICYPTFGGSGIIASELGHGLSDQYKIHFIAYEKPVRLHLSNQNIFYHKVNIPHYPLFEYPPYELALTARIVEVVLAYNLDLLHVHYAIPHAYAAVNARKILLENNIDIPIITTLHGTDITLIGKSPFVLSAVNYAINQSSLVTSVSENLKSETLKHFNIKHNIKVIPNFIRFKTEKPIQKLIKHKKTICHISNFRAVKRVLDVISVFYNIQKVIDAELIMIGEGPDFKKAISLVSELGLDHVVKFVGKTKTIEKFLKESDLFLLPSESESFGLVALEAMSFSIPVITTNSGGVTELVLDNKNGYTCNVGDVDEMSKKAINLLSNQNLYLEYSDLAYKTAKKYDIDNIIPLYSECYLQLLNR